MFLLPAERFFFINLFFSTTNGKQRKGRQAVINYTLFLALDALNLSFYISS
jgi:hypothetical protein